MKQQKQETENTNERQDSNNKTEMSVKLKREAIIEQMKEERRKREEERRRKRREETSVSGVRHIKT